ncbi:MAG: efflux RND transporter periplasmic adaptor subunit [Gemmataceae bacterium]|nr:efflux RND transporter periplasmic adaptor subunit [Gemmataceae bacterium]
MTHRLPALALFLAAAAALAGCAKPQPPLVKALPPDVVVEYPTARGVTDFEDFTGHTEAYRVVEVRPQVTGLLEKVYFKDGDFVNAGDRLFDIDDDYLQAQRDGAEAARNLARAKRDLAKTLLATAEKARTGSALGADEYAKARAEYEATIAAEKVAEFDLKKAETTLGYTKIAAPYTGRLGRRMVDPGAVVKENDTALTRLVVVDPIYVSFDIDERTLLRVRRLIAGGKVTSARDARLDVQVGLADEDGFSFAAPLTFADNQLDPNTGTLRLRAEMPNPSLQHHALPAVVGAAAASEADLRGLKLLSPGMFVRVRLPVGREHPGLLIPEEAIGSDQGQRFVYVLNDKDEAVYRRVRLGPQEGRLRVIEPADKEGEGVKPTDRVVVSGLQRVRPGSKVNPRGGGQPAAGSGQTGPKPPAATGK